MTQLSRPRVLIADPLAEQGVQLLQTEVDVLSATQTGALARHLDVADGLIVRSRTQVTADLLNQAPRLRLVARAGIGVDNIDVTAASARGILVINAPLGNVQSTAEHTIALLFALARRVPAADTAIRNGAWKAGYEGMQLQGKRLGIIGMGKIGSRVAEMARGFGLEVVACDPYLPEQAWVSAMVRRVDAEELLRTSDLVSLHLTLTPQTENLIGKAELAVMKRGSYFINCARGALVDEQALAEALHNGRLAGAALDVFRQEPLVDSPLLSAPNLILTPHVAASTREAQVQVSTEVALQVLHFFAGRAIGFPVNPSVIARG